MNEEIKKAITEIFFSNFKEKIKEESLKEFLLSKKKEDLEKILKINTVIINDKDYLNKISNLNKNELVKEIINNIDSIYKNILINVDILIYDQIEDYIKSYKSNIMTIKINKLNYSPALFQILSTFLISKINYDKDKGIIEIYTPKELISVLKDLFKDKSIEKECENNSEIIDNVESLIQTYGVIELSELINIYNNVFDEIDEEDLKTRIFIDPFFDEKIHIVNEFSDYLIYGLGFNSDKEAQEFLMKLPKKLDYKIYTKEEYDEIREGSYHYNIDVFDVLHDFLTLHLGMNDDQVFDFDEMFVLDYMYSYQLDSSTAKKNLSNNLNKMMPDLDFTDKAHLSKIILSIAKNYPNYNFKGHTYNEVGDKYR